jgi:hypothetical protein
LLFMVAGSAEAAVSDCLATEGVFLGSGENDLSNGTLLAGFCGHTYDVKRVNIQYQKTGGGTVTLRFGWQFVDANGGNAKSITWDAGAFTQSSGQTKYYKWTYPTITPDRVDPARCMRGVLRDVNAGVNYSTRVVC